MRKHKDVMKQIFSLLIILMTIGTVQSQIGLGVVVSNDLYNHYTNPDDGISDPTHGNAVLNLAVGPKIWFGGKKFSISIESQANLGITGFTLGENKGLGSLAIPVLANLNFRGSSSLDREGKTGFFMGGGIQYVKTELYGLSEEFIDKGVTRDYFQLYVIQAGYGFGVSGAAFQGFVRYGFSPDSDAQSWNIGIQADFNFLMMKKIDDPNSAL